MILFTQNKEEKNEFNIQYSGKKELEALCAEFGGFHTGQVCCGPSPILLPARPCSIGLVSHLILAFAIIVRHNGAWHKTGHGQYIVFLFIWSYYAHQSEGHLGLLYVRRMKAAFCCLQTDTFEETVDCEPFICRSDCTHSLVSMVNHGKCHPLHAFCLTNDFAIG